MKLFRRLLSTVWLIALIAGVSAQTYPSRAVKIVIPYPPGQGIDILLRIIGERVSADLGQPFVVENKAGASGTIGTYYVTQQAPDGYTLLGGSSGAMTISPVLTPEIVQYNTLKDFEPISGISTVAQVFVVPANSPYKTLQDLIKAAKQKPGELNFASSGKGSTQHLFVEHFAGMTGIKLQHIPYKGAAPALTGLLGGQVDFMSETTSAIIGQIRAGTVRPLAVTSSTRSEFLPDVPTIAESGVPGYEAVGWITVLAPAGTPAAIADKLYAEIQKVMADPEIRKKMIEMGQTPMTTPRGKMKNFYSTEIEKWRKVIADAKLLD